MYTVSFTEVAVTAKQDLFQIGAVTNNVTIHHIVFGQTSDVGDAEAESRSVLLSRVTDAITDGTAEVKLDPSDGAALANLNVNQTTQKITGIENAHSESWNIAQPFIWLPPPELRIKIRPGNAFVVSLNVAPNDSLTMSGTIYFEESG